MVLHDDVHIVPGGFPGGFHAGLHHLELLRCKQSGGIQERERFPSLVPVKEVDLDGVKTLGQRQFYIMRVVLGLNRPQVLSDTDLSPAELKLAGVGAQLVPHFAA